MREQIHARDRGGEIGGVGQRRYLVAEERARHHRAGGPVGRQAEAVTDAHQRETDGAERAPGGAQRHGDHGTEDRRGGEKGLRAEQFQAVVDQGRDGARCDPHARDHADQQQNPQSRQTDAHHVQHAVLHGVPAAAVEPAERGGDADTEY